MTRIGPETPTYIKALDAFVHGHFMCVEECPDINADNPVAVFKNPNRPIGYTPREHKMRLDAAATVAFAVNENGQRN